MGRGMKAGRSHRERLGNSGITWDVIHEAQRRLDAQYETLRLDASVDATKTIQAMMYYSMYELGYEKEKMLELFHKMAELGTRMESGDLNFDIIYDTLDGIGIEAAK